MPIFMTYHAKRCDKGQSRRLLKLIGILAGMILLVVLNVPSISLLAQAGPTPVPTPTISDDQVNQIAKGLYCPVCQNVPLEVCQTEACARWREQVRELLAEGESEQQIRDYFVQHFGARTVGVPTNPTAELLTVVLPFVLVGLILAVIAYNLVLWRRRRAAANVPERANPPGQAHDSNHEIADDYRTRLEEDLRKRE